MNFKGISFYLGLFCFPISFLAFINILYSSYFDFLLSVDTYFITLIVSLSVGSGLSYYGKKSKKNINFFEQLILIVLSYLFTSVLIAIPFYLSNYQVTFLNSIFESVSGLTGTGFSIFKNIKYLDPTLILWRSSSQWVGGLYFLFFLIIVFSNKSFNYKMTNLTYSGDYNFNSKENTKENLIRIFIIYSSLSIIILTLLNISGLRLFNSLNMTMTLVSGGGFLPTDNINKIIETNLQKIIFIFSLLISMLNVYLLFNIFNKKTLIKDHKEDVYLIVLTIILFILIYFNNYKGLDIIISVVSSLANSGLSLVETDNNLSLYFLLITMVGGSLISNTSGIKLTRFYILLKITSAEIIKLVSPNSVINKTIYNTDQKISDENVKISFLVFISFFLSLLILSSFLVIDNIGFEKSFKLSILALTNTVNSEMYNMQNINFSNLLTSSKISLILFMIIGKIELISIFLIFKKILFKD
jgi:trk system potassium uptake protein TrkH